MLEEMLREVVDAAGRPGAARELSGTPLPETVRHAILLRVQRLEDDQVAVLETAAILGRSFDAETLLAVSGEPESVVHAALDAAITQQLLEEDPSRPARYRWRHALTQEAIYAETVTPRRQAIHSRAADALAGSADAHPVELANHLLGAARFEEAVPVCLRSAEEAEATLAFGEAVSILERALPYVSDPLENARVLCRIGTDHQRNGEPATAVGYLTSGIEALEEHGEELEASHHRLILGRCHWESERPDAARAEYERALAVLEPAGPSADLAMAHQRLAGMAAFRARLPGLPGLGQARGRDRGAGGRRLRARLVAGIRRPRLHRRRRAGPRPGADGHLLQRGSGQGLFPDREQHGLEHDLDPYTHDAGGARGLAGAARVAAVLRPVRPALRRSPLPLLHRDRPRRPRDGARRWRGRGPPPRATRLREDGMEGAHPDRVDPGRARPRRGRRRCAPPGLDEDGAPGHHLRRGRPDPGGREPRATRRRARGRRGDRREHGEPGDVPGDAGAGGPGACRSGPSRPGGEPRRRRTGPSHGGWRRLPRRDRGPACAGARGREAGRRELRRDRARRCRCRLSARRAARQERSAPGHGPPVDARRRPRASCARSSRKRSESARC